jgi:predicted dehydrogenase
MEVPLGVAFIGCGGISRAHGRALQEIPEAQLIAAMDIVEERAQHIAEQFGARYATTDLERVLDDPDVEAVLLALPHAIRVEPTVLAAEAGKHILVEKPMAPSLEEADAMMAAAEAHGVTLMVAQVLRFRTAYQRAKELLEQGRIGTPTNFLRRRIFHSRRAPVAWATNPEVAKGWLLYGYGSHEYDMVLWLDGSEVTQLYAEGRRTTDIWGDEDEISATFSLSSGATGTVLLSMNCHRGAWDQLVIGTEGSLYITNDRVIINNEETIEAPMDPTGGFAPEWREFIAALREGREPIASGHDVRRTMVALEMVKRSLRERRLVRAEEVAGATTS